MIITPTRMGLTKAIANSDNRKLWQAAEKVARAVILSPFASLRVNFAKDLHLLGTKEILQMLRSAQHDR
jgi:hypothetical protein